MKDLITNYVFDPVAKTITFAEDFSISQLLLITNVTDGETIYLFNSPTLLGTLSNRVLTLMYDTTTMSSADALQIFYDKANTDFQALTDVLKEGLVEIIRQLQSIRNDGGMADVNGRVRVAIETGSVSITANQDLRTLATVTNMGSVGGYALNQNVMSITNQMASNLRNKIIVT